MLPYKFQPFDDKFLGSCKVWLATVKIIANEILRNYIIKEDILLIEAFSSKGMQRFNRVFKAYGLKYSDYPNLAKDDGTGIKKCELSMLQEEAIHGLKKQKHFDAPVPKAKLPIMAEAEKKTYEVGHQKDCGQ